MPDMPRTKFNSPWTVANIEAELNGVKTARGNMTLSEALAAKQALLVVGTNLDAVPTAESTNPVTSGGVNAPLAELVDGGSKNIFVTSTASSTITDCTFTNNSDGSWTVTASGAVAERRQKALSFTVPATLQSGDYVLSGCPSGGASATAVNYCLYLWDTTENARVSNNDVGNGIAFSWNPDPTHSYNIAIDIRGGTNPNGLIFKPMICTKAAWDVSHAYQPYRPSYQELYEMVLALQNDGTRSLSVRSEPAAEPDDPEESEER